MDENMKTELDNMSIKETVQKHQEAMEEMDREADKQAATARYTPVEYRDRLATALLQFVERASKPKATDAEVVALAGVAGVLEELTRYKW